VAEYSFVLYVTGGTPRSQQARENLRRICDDRLSPDEVEIGVVDVLEEPERAEADRVIATPCVIRVKPDPPQRVIGDLSATSQVAAALGLPDRLGPPGHST
jgi:circadian clock protein KaiB